MMTDNELNSLLNEFLADETTDGNEEFVQSVMKSLPPEPRFAWIREMFPAAILFVTLLTIWKIKILTPAVLIGLATKGLESVQVQWQALSPMTGMALLGGLFCLVCYYAYETFAEI